MAGMPKVGIIVPEAEDDLDGRTPRWSDYVEMAQVIEDLQYDSLWFVDHYIYKNDSSGLPPQGAWECWSMLSALAAATNRVELGSLVTATSFRNPTLLAKTADTIDEISNGRLILGVGAGWNEVEYRMYGFPFDHRFERFQEAFTILTELLRDGQIDFAGKYYTARDCELRPRGPRAGGPPIMIGSRGPKMLAHTLPTVPMWNGWLCDVVSDVSAYGELQAMVDTACAGVGRNPEEVERTISISIDPTGERDFPRHWSLLNDLTKAFPLTGSTEDIARGIRAFGDAGVSHLQVYPIPPTLKTMEQIAPAVELARSMA